MGAENCVKLLNSNTVMYSYVQEDSKASDRMGLEE